MVDKPKYEITFTAKGFNDLFDYHLVGSKNNVEAYKKAENEHLKVCGRFKYSSYHTFKQIRRRYMQK
jgi:hypothetical protein